MNFNSVVFLFCFMPLALGLYYLVPGRVKNAVLLVESLLFFCWGGITWLPLAVGMVAINYAAGLLLASLPAGGKRKIMLIAAIVLTAAALVYCKYTNFLLDTLNVIASTGFAKLSFLDVLPLGISYYTFKLISYTADVYTGKVKAERSPVVFAVYVLMYPQLIVGPIVKYRDMADVLHQTQGRCTLQKAQDGAEMFVFGLAKKVILADSIAALWQDIIGTGGIGLANASLPLAWLGIIAYSLQLYFDFAGYSEMSNGLSLMMGFECPANFNLPYISGSITEFWRRWHISLSGWFRDYIYIPLGGNRCSAGRQMLNMLAVWALTGIWHGANWNFICWGLYYFVLLVIEKNFLMKYLKKGKVWPHIYTLFLVVLGWGLFTCNAPGAPLGLLLSRLFIPQGGVSALYFLRNYAVLLVVCCVCSTQLPGRFWQWCPLDGVIQGISQQGAQLRRRDIHLLRQADLKFPRQPRLLQGGGLGGKDHIHGLITAEAPVSGEGWGTAQLPQIPLRLLPAAPLQQTQQGGQVVAHVMAQGAHLGLLLPEPLVVHLPQAGQPVLLLQLLVPGEHGQGCQQGQGGQGGKGQDGIGDPLHEVIHQLVSHHSRPP